MTFIYKFLSLRFFITITMIFAATEVFSQISSDSTIYVKDSKVGSYSYVYEPSSGFVLAVKREIGQTPSFTYFSTTDGKTLKLKTKKKIALAQPFFDGLALIMENDTEALFGYINTSGEYIIQPQFLDAQDFRDGKAWVQSTNGLWGQIDKKGKWVEKPSRISAPEFAVVFNENIPKPNLGKLSLFPFGEELSVIINEKREIVLKQIVQNIRNFDKNRLLTFVSDGKTHIFDLSSLKILKTIPEYLIFYSDSIYCTIRIPLYEASLNDDSVQVLSKPSTQGEVLDTLRLYDNWFFSMNETSQKVEKIGEWEGFWVHVKGESYLRDRKIEGWIFSAFLKPIYLVD